MKNDISSKFKKLGTKKVAWPIKEFFEVRIKLIKEAFEESYWEGEENWVSLSTRNDAVGYIWRRHPLIICKESFFIEIQKSLNSKFPFIEYIKVTELGSPELIIDSELALEFFDQQFECPISAEDIWFYTNSI